MELFCIRLFRGSRSYSVSTQLTRHFQTRSHGQPVKSRQLSSVDIFSKSGCQPTTTSVQFPLRTISCWRHAFSSVNARRIVFTPKSPKTIRSRPCSPVPTQCGQVFHTSSQLGALPAPLIWMILKPVQKFLAIVLGRSFRMWWVNLPPNRRQYFREVAWQKRWHLTAGASVALVILALFLLTHLDEAPLTGRTRLLVFSRENFMELAAITAEGYMDEYAELMVPEKDPRHQLVEQMVQHLARRNQDIPEISRVPWSVHVVEKNTVNAFVLPNGKVFVFTGMLETVADVHQLAFILGHEMAHALMGHSAEQASLSHVLDFLSVILLTAIWAVCPRDSIAILGHWIQGKLTQLLFNRPYSRKLEAEADRVGLQLAAKACADVRAGPVFWQQMDISDLLKGEAVLPEWLSTHPSHRNRVTQLDRVVPQALELRESCDCPALPATDPRAIFSKSVHLLLEKSKNQGREGEGGTLKPLHLQKNPDKHTEGMTTVLFGQLAADTARPQALDVPAPASAPALAPTLAPTQEKQAPV